MNQITKGLLGHMLFFKVMRNHFLNIKQGSEMTNSVGWIGCSVTAAD